MAGHADIDIRPIASDEYETFIRATTRAFGDHASDEIVQRFASRAASGRCVAAFEGGDIVGGVASEPGEIGVEGARLPSASVVAVTVQPTHTRRGILTRLKRCQMRDLHDRGEPIAALWTSESPIYGRFGYGIATLDERWRIQRRDEAIPRRRESAGAVRFVDPGQAAAVFPETFRRAVEGRPGAIERPKMKWDWMLADPEIERGGGSALFHVVYESGDSVDGYASYRVAGSTLRVVELMAVGDDAHRALWEYLLGVDLVSVVEIGRRPLDDPLPWMLGDLRSLDRQLQEGLWVRLVDVGRALAERRYARNGRLVLDVRDRFCPWNEGTHELDAGPEGARVRRSTAEPDLLISAADLASVYLGAVAVPTLVQAGRVEERTPGSARQAAAMFATRLAPWCPYYF